MPVFVEHYRSYYSRNEGLAGWREIGARDKAANIVGLWTGEPPRRLAEIGFGDGAVLAELDRLGFGEELTGFEISATAIDAAAARSWRRRPTLVEFDGTTIPADAGAFDLAVLTHVVEHVADPRHLVAEAARIASYVLVEVPTELHARTPRHFTWTETGHVNLYSPLVIRHLVESCGLTVVGERLTNSSPASFRHRCGAARGLAKWAVTEAALRSRVGPLLFTYNCAILARAEGGPAPGR